MGVEFRTMLVLDDNRHDVSSHYVLCEFNAEAEEVNPLSGISTDPSVQQQQMEAFKKPPVALIVYSKDATVSDGVKIYGNGEMGGLSIEGHVQMGPPKIMLLQHYGSAGTHRDGVGPRADNKVNLTIGACKRINVLFEMNGWPIHFDSSTVLGFNFAKV